jgi:hypothetical protein
VPAMAFQNIQRIGGWKTVEVSNSCHRRLSDPKVVF